MRIGKRINNKGKYKKEFIEINTVDEFLLFYNKNTNSDDFLSLPNHVISFIESKLNDEVSYKKIIKDVSKLINSPRFKTQKNYWTVRGYSEKDSIEMVSKLQKNLSSKLQKKRKESPEKYKNILPNQIGYWTKQGFTNEEAINLVKERQNTFSLDTCINKYGESKGLLIFEERQRKWQFSRLNSEGNSWSYKDQGLSFKKYIERYGTEWILIRNKHLKKRKCNNKLIESNLIIYDLNYNIDLIKKYLFNCNVDEMFYHASNSVFNFILNMNHIEIKSMWMEYHNIKTIKSSYGNLYWQHGNYYKSDGEFIIGKYLTKLNLNFSVNIKYPDIFRYCDFYIKDLDLYIEYMGMQDIDYKNKIKQIKNLPYNIIWSNNINKIKESINEKIH